MTDVKLFLQTKDGPVPIGELTEFEVRPRPVLVVSDGTFGFSPLVALVDALRAQGRDVTVVQTFEQDAFRAWRAFTREMVGVAFGLERLLPRRVDRSKRRQLRRRTSYGVWIREDRARKRLERRLRLHRRLTRRRRRWKRPLLTLWALTPMVRFPLFDQPFKGLE